MAQSDARQDVHAAFRFGIEIDGLLVAGFNSVSGLTAEMEPFRIEEGGLNSFVHIFAGRTSFPPLVLKRGITDTDYLWQWYDACRNGNIQRRSGSIVLYSYSGDEVRRWHFESALPMKWKGPELLASSGEVALESLELMHQGLTLAKSS